MKASWLLGLIPLGLAFALFGDKAGSSPPSPPNPGKPPQKPRPGGGTVPVTFPNPSPEADLPLEVQLPFAPDPLSALGMSGGGLDGLAWANALPGTINKVREAGRKPRIKQYTPAREKAVLDAVRAGHANYSWGVLTLGPVDGTYLTIPVFTRTLRIGETNPVRVSVNFQTQQQIADLLGGAMMTPYVVDELERQGALKVKPTLENWSEDLTMDYTDAMVDYSHELDKKIPTDLSQVPTEIVNGEGKDWVVTKRFWIDPLAGREYAPEHGKKALWSANYGWLWEGDKNAHPIDPPAPSTNQVGLHLYQPVGLRHNFGHTDYSQQLRLMGLYGILSGKREGIAHVGAILRDPVLHKLLSYEGTLPSWKHPAFSTGGEPPRLPGEMTA